MDVLLGSKWYRYNEEGKLVVLRVVRHNSDTNVSVITLKDKLEEIQSLDKRKIEVEALEQDYTMLNPDGYVTFNIVTIGEKDAKHIQDIIVTLHRLKDLNSGNKIPYAVCRQNIINTYSTVIMKHSTDWEVGMTMSVETIPEGIDYNIMTACNTCDKVISVAAYLDDTLDDIIRCIKPKDLHEYDYVLNELYHDHINNIPKEFREEACRYPIHKGYCRYLTQLLSYTDFMYDFERAFGVARIKDISIDNDCITNGNLIDGFTINNNTLKIIEKEYGHKFINPIFFLFDKDINIEELSDNVALIKDDNHKVYLCNYIKQK